MLGKSVRFCFSSQKIVNQLLATQEPPSRTSSGLRRFGSGRLPDPFFLVLLAPRSQAARISKKETAVIGRRLPARCTSRNPAATSDTKLPVVQPEVKHVAGIGGGPLVNGSILGAEVTFLVDSGADVTILSPAALSRIPKLPLLTLEEVETNMLLADGSSLPFLGCGLLGV